MTLLGRLRRLRHTPKTSIAKPPNSALRSPVRSPRSVRLIPDDNRVIPRSYALAKFGKRGTVLAFAGSMRNQKFVQWVAWVLVAALVLGAVATALSLFMQ
ncbi:hypothetical protein BH18ACT5_BH18ACT5_08230 [soil metagenome]